MVFSLHRAAGLAAFAPHAVSAALSGVAGAVAVISLRASNWTRRAIQTVALSPWLMLPALPVTIAILAFNFLGDGLRDAADPYGV